MIRATCACVLAVLLGACKLRFDERPLQDGGTVTPDRPPSACTFAGGAHQTTMTRPDGRVGLAPGAMFGQYTLPVCEWNGDARSLVVVPAAPYGKPLVTTSETDYPAGNLDASALVGLWHLDGALGPLQSGASIVEATTLIAGVTVNADSQGMARTSGVFGAAIECDGVDDYVEIAPSSAWRGFEKLTIQVWGSASYTGPAAAFGRLVSYWETGDTLGSTFQVSHFPSGVLALMVVDSAAVERGAGDVWGQTAGLWHHIVGVYDGSELLTYVDGVPSVDRAAVTGTIEDRTGSLYFCQGGSSSPPPMYNFGGRIDEVALWKRALSPAEIRALYERGVANVRAQVRSCDAPCTSEPFVGPDGTTTSFFSEAGSTSAGLAAFDLSSVTSRRYLQVAVTLSRSTLMIDPQLVDVIVTP